MVFGLFEGKIDLKIAKTNFAFGEVISGELVLNLKKPKKARQLRVALQATERRTNFSTNISTGKTTPREQDVIIFSTEAIVGGEKEYPVGEARYSFSVQAPQQLSTSPNPLGTMRIGPISTQGFMASFGKRIRWELKASLDVPGSVDVSKNVQVSVN